MNKVLLTGGAGYIGSHAAKYFAAQGLLPVVFDNLEKGHREAVQWGPLEEGDIADSARLLSVLEQHRPVAIVHFAAHAYVGESMAHPAKYYANNVGGTLSLLEAMRQTGIHRILFSSTCATYGVPEQLPITEEAPQNPVNPYGKSKLMVEKILEDYGAAYGFESVCLRYFNAAGADPDGLVGECHDPETHLIPLALDAVSGRGPALKIFGTDYPTPDGTCVRDYIHVTDLAQAHHLALRHLMTGKGSARFNLGNGKGYSVREVLDAVAKVAGRPVPAEFAPRRAGDPPALVGSSGKAVRELGWSPRYAALEAIVETAWKWHQNPRFGVRLK
jgi:UDP-arabinose 4-epimerase